MKKLIILIIGIVMAVPAFCQQPDEAGSILHRIWPEIELIQPQAGKPYKVLLRKDHALYAENIPDSTWVTICYGCGQQPVAQIDTVDSEALTYTGWARHGATSAPGWHAGTISYSSTGEASYTFTGTRVQIFGETKPTDGTGTVTIGDKTGTAEYNKAQVLPAMVYDSGVMPRDEHTMTLKPETGSINVDFLVITK